MDIVDKIREWGEDGHVIWANRVGDPTAYCELCGTGIGVTAASRAKNQLPDWHLVCRECVGHIVREKGPLRFMGRFKTESEAKRVLG